ncbi:TPA: carbon starvation protein A [Aeromonas salmonicida subsp. salmonicida]|uniref:carbon starvation CstA family protein n=1 Tax=Aeromonas salmonicida TaxID=645 RepID=UPI00132046A1|nr:carbon starvation protein A [Aeromonas salmonicida]ELI6419669.1 carbon starvation protein A [Aeromonas salmonicida subsp. salmonicida]ELM3648085.1 carbon starvation protein A [Aeromonas salmonicida subsp. salmonicida]QHE45502.1 carbon starvation protein A [Aeromonas salmonicida subsp. salmonicida]QHE47308.1 carbon starvation protein A [Aeromonas salmonicida subsp. salmonicida]QJF55053.1 carbon starvation protein A [Aeromonas salmonicida subsp. salmonicida]
MIWFFLCVGLLVAGYFIYGKFIERIFGPKPERATPAITMADGVDYVPMSDKKVYLVQLLNIAGIGPIFGPILGALYGPVAMLWIVFGCIFAGAVHDYFSGMLSVRAKGASVPTVVGEHLGTVAKHFMNLFAVVLLMLVGVVFVLSPAGLLANLTSTDLVYWIEAIFAYYILATIVPIDKIIGRFYPIFGALLVFMSVGLIVGLIVSGKGFYNTGMDFSNLHPTELPLWPLLFITIACGAVSGFHATQSPLMARCMQNEKSGRFIFYGAMIGEGVIALIWCTLGLSFYESTEALNATMANGGPAAVVHEVSTSLLGTVGGILAILGVVILPITSGDTAFRSARLIVADFFNLTQKPMAKRLLIAVPMFILGFIISKAEFGVIWRYFGWANQTTAVIMLWAAAAYLAKEGKLHWVCTIPAMFMTAVVFTYLANAPIGFGLEMGISTVIGLASTAAITIAFLLKYRPALVSNPGES